jgi:hypothetical protein
LTGWWRPFMARNWLAFAGTVIGAFQSIKRRGKISSSVV